MVDGFAGSGKWIKNLQAIGGFWVEPEWWQGVRDVCWLFLKLLLLASFSHLLHKSNFHVLAGQNSRILDPTPSRSKGFNETPVGRLLTSIWRWAVYHASYAIGVLVIPGQLPLQRLEGSAQHLFHLCSVIAWLCGGPWEGNEKSII